MSLAETRSHFILSTDFTDFTDFATRVLGYGLAALLGLRHLLDGLDSLDGLDGRERIARKRACGGRIRAEGELKLAHRTKPRRGWKVTVEAGWIIGKKIVT